MPDFALKKTACALLQHHGAGGYGRCARHLQHVATGGQASGRHGGGGATGWQGLAAHFLAQHIHYPQRGGGSGESGIKTELPGFAGAGGAGGGGEGGGD